MGRMGQCCDRDLAVSVAAGSYHAGVDDDRQFCDRRRAGYSAGDLRNVGQSGAAPGGSVGGPGRRSRGQLQAWSRVKLRQPGFVEAMTLPHMGWRSRAAPPFIALAVGLRLPMLAGWNLADRLANSTLRQTGQRMGAS